MTNTNRNSPGFTILLIQTIGKILILLAILISNSKIMKMKEGHKSIIRLWRKQKLRKRMMWKNKKSGSICSEII